MTDSPFLLVSLEEEKSKKLAQVLSNDTARKILDYLSKTENATETQISKKLKVPLSTIHYNMQLLVKADLVEDKSFTYSEKGKEIIHYTLADKYVIIVPKKTDKIKAKLKEFLPIVLLSATIGFLIKYLNKPAQFAAQRSAPMDAMMAEASLKVSSTPILEPNLGSWFFLGSIFSLIIYILWNQIISKR